VFDVALLVWDWQRCGSLRFELLEFVVVDFY
jgi:hypothetical protein